MQSHNEVILAALAGLWHDIGKISQRAGERGGRTADDEMERDYGSYHALLSADAVTALAPPAWRDPLVLAVKEHHQPQTKLAAFVSVADFLSAGERADDETGRAPLLQSIFSTLYGYNQPHYYALASLQPERLVPLPAESTPRGTELEADYHALWTEFSGEVRALPNSDLTAYLEAFQDTLQRYTWCIPSAYYHAISDISLYDHSRMTGALAACFTADGRTRDWALALRQVLSVRQEAADEPLACLVGGDLSGIQAYLYNTASNGATRSLCGRSFYLQLLTEAVALSLLDALEMPITNLLYAGGGHFYLIAPANNAAREVIKERYQRLMHSLLQAHEGRLSLAIAQLPLSAGRFLGEAFGSAWNELNGLLAREKKRRLAGLGDDLPLHVGAALGQGGHPDQVCQICGREGAWAPDEDGAQKCSFCDSLEELGRDLGRATALLLCSVPASEQPVRTWRDGLRRLGLDIRVLRPDTPAVLADSTSFARLWEYLPEKTPALIPGAAPLVRSHRFLPVLVPQKFKSNGSSATATFEDLAQASSTAIKQWGVLRMDVDNLGSLFHQGLQQATLSRVASLSSQFRLFFEGAVPLLAMQFNTEMRQCRTEGNSDLVYLIYAGGDDLFAVGTWDILPGLADAIHSAFGRFAAGNPQVTVSAGIAIYPQKYPLYLAAKEAGTALDDQAKAYQRPDGRRKDALSFLGMTIGWEDYLDISERVVRWTDWVRSGVAPRAVIQLLRQAVESASRPDSDGKVRLGPTSWRLVYMLARRREEAQRLIRSKPELEEALCEYMAELDTIERIFVQGQLAEQQRLLLLARWTEYLTRGGAV
ncbi:MAG: type III-A CRISPR-associated protein Cas10/Csm1 [Chloroflexi bacterium]|nr:type III-A CRISPR-associated protein Cas10/Csm1 [Chloroflexota bacterium]